MQIVNFLIQSSPQTNSVQKPMRNRFIIWSRCSIVFQMCVLSIFRHFAMRQVSSLQNWQNFTNWVIWFPGMTLWLFIASAWQQVMGAKVRIQIEFYLDPHFCTNNPLHTQTRTETTMIHPIQLFCHLTIGMQAMTVHCIRIATGHGCKSADPDRILSRSAFLHK